MARPSVEAARKEQILRAACAIIGDVGCPSLRVSDVAKRAGTSTGTVHYYFDTKRDLLHAAFEWNYHCSVERRVPVLAGHVTARDRLRALIESYLPGDPDTNTAWHVWAELWVAALHDPDLQLLNERVYGEWRNAVAAIIAEGQDRGDFRDGDPVDLANAVVGLVDGLALQVLNASTSMTASRMRSVCLALLDSLEPRSA